MSSSSLEDDNPWGAPTTTPAAPAPPSPVTTSPAVVEDAVGWEEPALVPTLDPVEGGSETFEPAVVQREAEVSVVGEEASAPEEHEREHEAHAPTPLASPTPEERGPPPMDAFPDDAAPAALFDDGGFGDDDDFGELGGGDDDDFGDFDEGDMSGFGSAPPMTAFDAPPPAPTPAPPPPPQPVASTSNPAFRLDLSTPTRSALAPTLAPFWESRYPAASDALSAEPERQVEGIGQVLVSDSARTLLTTLSSLPPLRPLDWRRSKIRREHLIALGVPVNLDDSADTKPLASLVLPSQQSQPNRLSTSPQSAPARTSSPLPFSSNTPYGSRSPTPSEDRRRIANLPPPLDKKRAGEVCAIPEDDLLLLGLGDLEKLKAEIEKISIEASGALTHALLMREKEVGDGETYHGMIQVRPSFWRRSSHKIPDS
ncbi:hypothetical protein RQP46_007062 [Phenoliferia psychrophenolica]